MLGWILVGAYAAIVYGCRKRALPVTVMRAWFTFHLALSVLVSAVLCGVVFTLAYKKLGLISKSKAENLSRALTAFAFGYVFPLSCQHVQVKQLEGSLPWSSITEQHDFCLCHTSFFDTVVYLWLVPYRYIYSAKTFVKASLRKLPVFGSVVVACGQFPVYFVSEESSSFSVNKDKQAQVAAEVEEFLKVGGSLSFFPEGALNRSPEVLTDFRLGSFHQILAHKLPVYYCISFGNHEVWNADLKGMPGYPADIYFYIGKCEYDASTTDAKQLATQVRETMQKKIDEVLEIRKRTGYQPWYVASPKKAD